MSNVYEVLDTRGLISQCSSDDLKKRLEQEITLYCGFDPTGASLHIGHLLPIVMLKHFENHGHNVLVLVGGSTGLIGDPRMVGERTLNTRDTVLEYSESIKSQLSRFLDSGKVKYVNNYDWTAPISTIDFLRDYGKYFNVSYLLNKETVQSRLETGISFTEFSYTILQALDFKHLFDNHNCQLQLGGNDQWGNLTSGLELIHKVDKKNEVYAMTNPLVTKADGTKFGKSEGKAIWLDPNLTTPYEFYQFFLNSDDKDVIKYLKYFTFLSLDEIAQLETDLEQNPHLRQAQKTLASEITCFVHGQDAVDQVLKISECIFTGDLSGLTSDQIEKYFTHIEMNVIKPNQNILDFLIELKLASSKREAREFVSNNSIAFNGTKITDLEYMVTTKDAIEDTYMIVKRGKKKIAFVKLDNE